MAHKKNIPPPKVAAKPLPPLQNDAQVNKIVYFAVAIIITLVCFANAFKGGFTNWDDVQYVTENNLIKSLSWDNIKTIFSTLSVMGNYHPLAVLSLAIDFHFNKLEPHGFHTTSIVIHLLNVGLVFIFIQLLTEIPLLAFIVALLFGIHPMHVESVAWVSERKDVLYVFFYMASLISYLFYVKKDRNILFLVLSFILFGCSLLSKAQAVTLPIALILVDYYLSGKIELKKVLEKIPFFILAIIMGWIAVMAQKETGAIKEIPNNPLFERMLFAGYSFMTYTIKLIYPDSLSAYYPYPDKPYSLLYYIAPVVAIGLVAWAARYYKNRTLMFGVSFYVLNIFLLLQLLPVGGAMMAERYSYLCSIGLFFIAGKAAVDALENKKLAAYKNILIAGMVCYGAFLAYGTYERNKVWNNSGSLWSNVIKQYKRVPIAYNNLGSFYQKQQKLDTALMYFNEAINLKSSFPEARTNRSDIFRVKGDYVRAIADCDSAIATDKNYTEAYMNRGIAYCFVGKYDAALSDFTFVVSKKAGEASLYCNRGNLYDMKGKIDSAFSDYSEAIKLDPEYADAYFSRGRTYVKMQKYKEAIDDLNKAIELNTTSNNVYIYRSQAYMAMGNYSAAMQDITTAQKLGVQVNEEYTNNLKKFLGTSGK